MTNLTDNKNSRAEIQSGRRIVGSETVSGVVHVIRDEQEISRFREGEILVAHAVDPAWHFAFDLAKGIITESGSPVDGAEERELAVTVGAVEITMALRSGDIIAMHGDGSIEILEERRAPDSPMRVSVPAAVASRALAEQMINGPDVIALPGSTSHSGAVDDNPDHQEFG